MTLSNVPGSFRDPSGFLFYRNGQLLRQINNEYRQEFEFLLQSGLYEELCSQKMLVPHKEMSLDLALNDKAYRVIKPHQLPFISYPYEWSFSQLKDAALLTLSIQQMALEKDMVLKDASAYNVQFFECRPVFIDTLSFEKYQAGTPWCAYRQFCQHFLAPLALMSRTHIGLNQLLRLYIDGIPLDIASSLLPKSSKLNFSLGLHIHLHAKSQKKHAHTAVKQDKKQKDFSKRSFIALIDSLKSFVKKLTWKPGGTEWYNYYENNNNYGEAGLKEKEQVLLRLIKRISPKTVWDLGSNTGRFSRIAIAAGATNVISWDIDPACVESNYKMMVKNKESGLLPLLLDLTNPSPGIGWDNKERSSFGDRGPADTVLALGLIHHLAIANNVPLSKIAYFLCKLSPWLIIEFVPKDDSQVEKLLATRKDIFPTYTTHNFEKIFEEQFIIEETINIPNTKRTLYCMKRRDK